MQTSDLMQVYFVLKPCKTVEVRLHALQRWHRWTISWMFRVIFTCPEILCLLPTPVWYFHDMTFSVILFSLPCSPNCPVPVAVDNVIARRTSRCVPQCHSPILLQSPRDAAPKDPLSPSSREPLSPHSIHTTIGVAWFPSNFLSWEGVVHGGGVIWWEGALLSIRELPSFPRLPTWQDLAHFASHFPLSRNRKISRT